MRDLPIAIAIASFIVGFTFGLIGITEMNLPAAVLGGSFIVSSAIIAKRG